MVAELFVSGDREFQTWRQCGGCEYGQVYGTVKWCVFRNLAESLVIKSVCYSCRQIG